MVQGLPPGLPSLQVASSLATAPSWDAARSALLSGHISTVVVREPPLAELAEGALWIDARREDVQTSVRWLDGSGLEAEAEQRVAVALLPLWHDHAAQRAQELAPVFCRLADTFGRCLAERGLLEDGDASELRIRCAVQTSTRDFGASERRASSHTHDGPHTREPRAVRLIRACPAAVFHRDHVPLRLISTLHGEGTVILPDEALVSAREWREVLTMYDHDEGAPLQLALSCARAIISTVRRSQRCASRSRSTATRMRSTTCATRTTTRCRGRSTPSPRTTRACARAAAHSSARASATLSLSRATDGPTRAAL